METTCKIDITRQGNIYFFSAAVQLPNGDRKFLTTIVTKQEAETLAKENKLEIGTF